MSEKIRVKFTCGPCGNHGTIAIEPELVARNPSGDAAIACPTCQRLADASIVHRRTTSTHILYRCTQCRDTYPGSGNPPAGTRCGCGNEDYARIAVTVPRRDDDVQAVLEAWPEVRRLVLGLVGPAADIFRSCDTMQRLRKLVESLPEDV